MDPKTSNEVMDGLVHQTCVDLNLPPFLMDPNTSNEGTDGLVHQTSVDFDGGGGSGPIEKENATSINGTGCGGGGGDQFPKEPCRCMIDLFEMVNDPKTDELICWGASRTSLIIRNHNKFAEELLPHKNLTTFIRLLHNYGFKKISKAYYEYKNPWFQADNKHLLNRIVRREHYHNDNNVQRKRSRDRTGASQDVRLPEPPQQVDYTLVTGHKRFIDIPDPDHDAYPFPPDLEQVPREIAEAWVGKCSGLEILVRRMAIAMESAGVELPYTSRPPAQTQGGRIAARGRGNPGYCGNATPTRSSHSDEAEADTVLASTDPPASET